MSYAIGVLVNFTASSRKANLIPFGLFSPGDDLSWIADDNSAGSTWLAPTTAPDGKTAAFAFSGTPILCSYNGVLQFLGYGFVLSGPATVTFMDAAGNYIVPQVGDIIRAVI